MEEQEADLRRESELLRQSSLAEQTQQVDRRPSRGPPPTAPERKSSVPPEDIVLHGASPPPPPPVGICQAFGWRDLLMCVLLLFRLHQELHLLHLSVTLRHHQLYR